MESLERMSEGVECMKGEGERHVSPQQVLDDLSLIRVGRERKGEEGRREGCVNVTRT